jgi:acyl dehydratase
MSEFHLEVGDSAQFTKTVGESDVYLFAGITGDLSPNHVNEQFMRRTPYGKRIAHGVLLVGFMSTASTRILESARKIEVKETPVSIGYDRVRFLRAVCIGDTITVNYSVTSIDLVRRRSVARVVITNDSGQEVAVAEHIMKWVPEVE